MNIAFVFPIPSGFSILAVTEDACAPRFLGKGGDHMFFFDPKNKPVSYRSVNSLGEFSIWRFHGLQCDASKS